MLSTLLQQQAALYVSGVMSAQERESFELVIEFHDELREFVRSMAEVGTAVTLSSLRKGSVKASPAVKTRVLEAIAALPQEANPEAFVMTGPDGLVQWVNPAFTRMCGYTLEELRGRKLGPILQGVAA